MATPDAHQQLLFAYSFKISIATTQKCYGRKKCYDENFLNLTYFIKQKNRMLRFQKMVII